MVGLLFINFNHPEGPYYFIGKQKYNLKEHKKGMYMSSKSYVAD